MTDPTSTLAQGLSGSYLLERAIGEGGMATVYLAQDVKHQRPVALKVLKPELAQTLGPERFRREVTTAARLQHPHILSVFDSGETAGLLWFTMPFVRGESLRDRLRREGRLPVDEALRITREAAQALQHAHDEGIVHRDVKPENILLSRDGSTLVADFGIARALGGEAEAASNLTQTGIAIGTPTYMAPEQATGQAGVDARADQYSLAVMLYEMLAGEPPFTGPTPAALIAKRFTSAAPSVREKRPEVPAAADAALQRALALGAAERFGSIAEFARAVAPGALSSGAVPTVTTPMATPTFEPPRRRVPAIAMAAGAVMVLALGGFFLSRRGQAAPAAGAPAAVATGAPAAEGVRIAVIPFENQGDTANAYFADGMADAVRGKLTELPGLSVIARSSSAQYRGSTKSLREVAQELGVRYVLTGTVRWAKMPDGSRRVQLSPELVEVADGVERVRWQQPFDAPLTDVFQVQTDIAGKVAGALDVALGATGQQSLAARPTQNVEAYDAFLRAEAATQQGATTSPDALRKAEELLELAVQRDPTFALAWARLAGTKMNYNLNVSPSPARAKAALAALERAEALAPDEGFTLRMRASYEANIRRDLVAARAVMRRALAKSPNDVSVISAMASLDDTEGKHAEALAGFRRAWQLDPRSARRASAVAEEELWFRNFAQSREAARQAYELAPNTNTLMHRVMVEVAQGDLPAARALIRDGITRLGRTEVGVQLAVFFDMFWALEPEDFRHVLGLRSDADFGGERHLRHVTQAQMHRQAGDTARARALADSALVELEPIVRGSPDDAQYAAIRGLMLALTGRRADAQASAERAVTLARAADPLTGRYARHQAARIYLELGEREKALDLLEPLLREPYHLSPGWLRLDRTLDGLRGLPRFEALASAAPHRLEGT